MNQKDYNELLNNISIIITPLNQLLYECLILIILYNLFNVIDFNNIYSHKSFIILVAIIFIGLDWFIWNNHIQTSLFSCVLLIYITYNFNKSKSISTFINSINSSRNNYENQKKQNKEIEKINNNNKIIKQKEKDEIDRITYIPKKFDANDCKNNNKSPEPFNKNMAGLNDLYVAYPSENLPSTHITDSRYAETILNSLYETPQYKNIKKECTDHTLKNDLYKSCDDTKTIAEIEDSNLELFRHPKKVFLDSKWLESKDYKYNDNCSGCMLKKPSAKNAICSVAKFGYELGECTNQEKSVNAQQLDTISTNNLKPIW